MNDTKIIPINKPSIGSLEIKAVKRVLSAGQLAQGKEVSKFEGEFAKFCGVNHAIAVNSGTAALHIALLSIGVKPGDEVITTPFSFIASASVILMVGAKPVFVDIDKETFNIDPKSILRKITKKTRAIIGVDIYGQCAAWKELQSLSRDNGIKLIGDSSQSHGARIGNSLTGSFGDVSTFSFYATKNMTTGEGGMVTTNNHEISELSKKYRQHGMELDGAYNYTRLGYNYRMTDISAAIGRVQLSRVREMTDKRISIAKEYNAYFSDLEGIITPIDNEKINNYSHVFHLYTLRVAKSIRDLLVKKITNEGIGCGIYYPKPLYKTKLFANFNYEECPETEDACNEVFSIPCEPSLKEKDINKIKKTVISCYKDLNTRKK